MFRLILPALLSGLIAIVCWLPLGLVAGFAVPDNVKTLAPDLDFHGTVWNGTVTGLPIFGSANLDITPLSRRALIQSGEGKPSVQVGKWYRDDRCLAAQWRFRELDRARTHRPDPL